MSRRAARLGLSIVVVLVALAGGEGLLRALDLPRFDACQATADYAVPDDELGFKGEAHGTVAGVPLNSLGLRGAEPAAAPVGAPRILFVGDSTCFGLGVSDADTFGVAAARRLSGSGADGAVQAWLGAFPGYSSYQSAILLERLLPFEPDLVVLYVGARNDGDRHRYFPDDAIPARRARLHAGWHRVRLLRAVEAAADRVYKSVLRKLRPPESRARVPLPAFRHNLEHMALLAREAGVPLLVVLPPISPRFAEDEPQVQAYRDALRAFSASFDLPTVSVDARFAAEPEGDVFFADHYHLTARGHAIVAEEIAKTVARERLLR